MHATSRSKRSICSTPTPSYTHANHKFRRPGLASAWCCCWSVSPRSLIDVAVSVSIYVHGGWIRTSASRSCWTQTKHYAMGALDSDKCKPLLDTKTQPPLPFPLPSSLPALPPAHCLLPSSSSHARRRRVSTTTTAAADDARPIHPRPHDRCLVPPRPPSRRLRVPCIHHHPCRSTIRPAAPHHRPSVRGSSRNRGEHGEEGASTNRGWERGDRECDHHRRARAGR